MTHLSRAAIRSASVRQISYSVDVTASNLTALTLTRQDIFGGGGDPSQVFMKLDAWDHPITYFLGRNGSAKSKAAKSIAKKIPHARFLATDRLVGLMRFTSYQWGSQPEDYQGVPLDEKSRPRIVSLAKNSGGATDELYSLREQPEVWLRVAAFLRRALHRTVELRESAGFLDPFVRVGATEYSLLREEGHGLREIVVLLAAAYRQDWSLLIVDEPELHLHPSLVRLWISELERECQSTNRRAILVSHEPSIVRPKTVDDLGALWVFRPDGVPIPLRSCVSNEHEARVSASLLQNPALVSQLAFSPRPVLVEGALDELAVNTALRRTQTPEVVAQTDVVDCGGNGGLAAWFTIARGAGLDVRAVGDLDCCLDSAVTSTLDSYPEIIAAYRNELFIEPPTTSTVVRPLLTAMNTASVPTNNKARAAWMATDMAEDGNSARRDKLLAVWKGAGLWLHKSGTLEGLLGLDEISKNREAVAAAASRPGEIDEVAAWAAFALDTSADVFALLSATVERIAHAVLEELRLSPGLQFDKPVGPTASGDARLVDVHYIQASGKHRLVVKTPSQYEGFWVEFDRETPPSRLALQEP